MIDNYHQDTSRISKSGLDLINDCPKRYWYKYLSGEYKYKPKKSLIEGDAFHELILRPQMFIDKFVIMPDFKGKGSLNKKNDWLYNNGGKDFITMSQYEMITGMEKSVRNHPVLKQLMKSGSAEETWTWTDKETGAKCKSRTDYRSDMMYFLDFKSTFECKPSKFKNSIFDFRYPVQDTFYTDGAKENGFHSKAFIFVAIEKEPPYLIKLHILSDEYQQWGRDQYKSDLRTYVQCIESGIWPDYGLNINEVEMPNFLQ